MSNYLTTDGLKKIFLYFRRPPWGLRPVAFATSATWLIRHWRCDRINYIYVRWKPDISQLSLPHEDKKNKVDAESTKNENGYAQRTALVRAFSPEWVSSEPYSSVPPKNFGKTHPHVVNELSSTANASRLSADREVMQSMIGLYQHISLKTADKTSGQSNSTYGRIDAAHGSFSRIPHVAPTYLPV